MYEVYNPQEQTKYVYITHCKFRWFKTRRLRIEQNLVNGLIYIYDSPSHGISDMIRTKLNVVVSFVHTERL